MNERIPQVLTFEQLALLLYDKLVSIVGTGPKIEDFKDMPLTRTDYYQLKIGRMIMSLTKLNKVCKYLVLPAPKIYL